MDIEAVKVLLEAQDRALKTALDVVVEQLESRIQLAEGTITDLIQGLEFTQAEMKDLHSEINLLVTVSIKQQLKY